MLTASVSVFLGENRPNSGEITGKLYATLIRWHGSGTDCVLWVTYGS